VTWMPIWISDGGRTAAEEEAFFAGLAVASMGNRRLHAFCGRNRDPCADIDLAKDPRRSKGAAYRYGEILSATKRDLGARFDALSYRILVHAALCRGGRRTAPLGAEPPPPWPNGRVGRRGGP